MEAFHRIFEALQQKLCLRLRRYKLVIDTAQFTNEAFQYLGWFCFVSPISPAQIDEMPKKQDTRDSNESLFPL